MRVLRPLRVSVPGEGVLFAESIHAAGFRMAERKDPFHKLVYVLDGRVSFRHGADGTATDVAAGTILAIGPGRSHQIADVVPSTLLLLCLGREFMASDPALLKLWQTLATRGDGVLALGATGQTQLEAWWRKALMERTTGQAEADFSLRLIAAQLLLFLVRRSATSPQAVEAPERIRSVIAELDETFFEEWSLERAAARAGLSRRRFSELFRRQTRMTFLAYLTHRRLVHAGALFRRGEHSVLGIMFSCGFSDLSHFYRVFRQHYGAPPRRWSALTSSLA